MARWAVLTLRAIIAVALAGSLVVQCLLVPLTWIDLEETRADVRIPLVAIFVLGVAALQVIGVCIWQLLTLVGRGTVFSHSAFRFVDTVIGAVVVGAVLILGSAVVAAHSNRSTPGDEVAPGLILLICGAALVAAGVALVVLLLRTLLRQAVALDSEAQHLRSELNEVI